MFTLVSVLSRTVEYTGDTKDFWKDRDYQSEFPDTDGAQDGLVSVKRLEEYFSGRGRPCLVAGSFASLLFTGTSNVQCRELM